MDPKIILSDAIDKRQLKGLSARSDAKGMAQLAGHFALLCATGLGVAAALGGPWLLPAMAVHGVVLVFLFAPLHETVHRTAFRSRRLNDTVASVCGFLLLLPPVYFRAFHFAHHRHTQDPARDPELARAKPRSLGDYLIVVSGVAYWRDRVTAIPRHAGGRVREDFVPPSQRPAVVREARIVLLLYAGVAAVSVSASSWWAVLLWAAPALIGQPALRMYLLAEHSGCPLVPDMLKNSRTTRSTAIVRWLAWNMPYHSAHHAYPAVPFHALPEAHALLQDRVAVQATGYLAVQREIIAGLDARLSSSA